MPTNQTLWNSLELSLPNTRNMALPIVLKKSQPGNGKTFLELDPSGYLFFNFLIHGFMTIQ